MSGDNNNDRRGSSRRSRLQLPWETEGHYSEEVRRRRSSPEIREIIEQEMGRHRLMGANSAPGLYFAPNANNPYFAFVYGVIFLSLPVAIGITQSSVALFFWLFLFFGFAGLLLIGLGAVRVRRWHRARAAVRAYIAEHGGSFPEELGWNR